MSEQEEINKEYLDNLVERLDLQHINYMSLAKTRQHLPEMREEVESQIPEEQDIIGKYTENQYVQNDITVDGIDLTFRTIAPFAFDEAVSFASDKSNNTNVRYDRILARRRLAYGLVEVNGRTLCASTLPQGSYFDIVKEDPDALENQIMEYGEKNYKALNFHGLTDKMTEIFGVWEKAIYDRMNGIDDVRGVLKN